MGRAEDLFRRLSDEGEEMVDALIRERHAEELFLDFKRSADSGTGSHLHDDDRKNFGKAISGFGNSEGGIVVWGVDCSRQRAAGDVANARVPIQNPRRFLSWLEGAVSGCTIPPHPDVRHIAIMRERDSGFVATYVARSHFAPHQTLHPPQFYIRAGSAFVPAPYGVLAGLFGRRPQPFVFHAWVLAPASVDQTLGSRAAQFRVGFLLGNKGPGLARDLYVNLKLFPPRGPSAASVEVPDKANWLGQHAFGVMTSLVSKDGFKLAPQALVEPLILRCVFRPPFESELFYEFTFGDQTSPTRSVSARTSPDEIQRSYDAFVTSSLGCDAGRHFVREIMRIPENAEERGPEAYDAPV